jgi:hypothetical protein
MQALQAGVLVQQGPPQYRRRTTCLLVRLTQLHGTEQIQEQSDSVQRVTDELLDEAAQRNSCALTGDLSRINFLEEQYCEVPITVKCLSINFNKGHLETDKKYT